MKKAIKKTIKVICIVLSLLTASLCLAIIIRFLMVKHADAANLETTYLSMTLGLIGALISAISLSLVVYQQHQSNKTQIKAADINEAEFLLKYNQAFIQDAEMVRVEQELEQDFEHTGKLSIEDTDRQRFINYLVYLEGLSPTVLKGIMRFESIDDLMAYRFFLAVNNRTLQENQLFAYPDYYKGCFKLYKAWKKYRKENNEEILNEETALDKWIHFDKYAGTEIVVRRAKESDDKKRIAKLIYNTDPYIYPAAFGNEHKAVKELSGLYSLPGNLFSMGNIWVALKSEKIVGAAVVLLASASKSLSQVLNGNSLPISFRNVTEDYFDKAYEESENCAVILCLSVNPNFQRQRIGRQLLSHIVSDSECVGREFKLDVLANNATAIKLYTECGFVTVGKTDGYAYNEKAPRVFEMKRDAENK